jgi:molybdate transport system ATP-binding protein
LISSGESLIVQVDCGSTLLAEITPFACRDMALQEGEDIYCLIKTHSIAYLTELDAPPHQRVVSHGDGHYYLDATGAANSGGLLLE